jgi:TetR/AcrR family transcriptional regulator, transcriptional repressor for nem operon
MKETRDEIITLADEFIRTRGFNAFSYADIAGIMDVRKPTLHYYFPSKSDLGISVIDKELEKMARLKEEGEDLPGDQQLKKLVEVFFNSSRKGQICLTGSLTPDYTTLPEPMQYKVQEMCRTILDWMAACLEKGRTEGCLAFPGTAQDRALIIMSGLLSSLLLSRVLGAHIFDRMIGQLLKDMNSNFQVTDLEEIIPEHLKD